MSSNLWTQSHTKHLKTLSPSSHLVKSSPPSPHLPLAVTASFLSHSSSYCLHHSHLDLHRCSVRLVLFSFRNLHFISSENKHLEQSYSVFFYTSFWSPHPATDCGCTGCKERKGQHSWRGVVCTALKGILLRITVKEGKGRNVFSILCSELWETHTCMGWDNSANGHKVVDRTNSPFLELENSVIGLTSTLPLHIHRFESLKHSLRSS